MTILIELEDIMMDRKTIITLCITIMLMLYSLPAFCKSTKKLPKQPEPPLEEYYNKAWWDKFNDTHLVEYIMKAAEKNYDVKISELKELEYEQWVRASWGKEFPNISIYPDFNRQRYSGNAYPSPANRLFTGSWNTFKLPMNVNYELDLWLTNRRKTQSQAKLRDASTQDKRSAFLSVTSNVGSVYFNILKADKHIELQNELIKLNEERYEILKIKYEAGLSSNYDVLTAQQNVIDSKNRLNILDKQRDALLNNLSVLTGETPMNNYNLERTSLDNVEIFKDIPNELPSESIMNRPDIQKAEILMDKAKIDVNLARKEFLPKISISGFLGYNAIDLNKLFDWKSFITGIDVNLYEMIFNAGQRKAKLKATKYQYEQMIQSYQKTFLVSLQELNDSMYALKTDIKTNEENLNKINIEKDKLNLITIRIEKGLLPRLNLVEGQQLINKLNQDQLTSKTDCLIDTISLYKSVGGKL